MDRAAILKKVVALVTETLEIDEAMREGVRLRPIIMCGCVPSRYGDELTDER